MATETKDIGAVQAKSGLDLATIIGMLAAFGLVIAAILQGAAPGGFIDIPSMFIVIGGTTGLVMACFSFQKLKLGGKQIKTAFLNKSLPPSQVALQLLVLAEQARKGGVLSIQDSLLTLDSQPLLQKGLGMVIDGNAPEAVNQVIEETINSEEEEARVSAAIMRKAADLSPAMGLIGTLIGLVQMLANLSDPNSIGPSMAVALITTFYGAVLANMVFTPIASKLELNVENSSIINTMYMHTIKSMANQENPRRLEMMLNTVLSDKDRVAYFD